MATWQFDICFVVENLVSGDRIAADQLDDLRNLEKHRIDKASLQVVIGNLAPAESWSKDLEIFGRMDGSRIDVCYEEGSVSGIMVRIDVTKVDKGFVERLVEFAKRNRLGVVDLEKRVQIKLQMRSLLAAILNSSAKEFVDDPESFLTGLIVAKHQVEIASQIVNLLARDPKAFCCSADGDA